MLKIWGASDDLFDIEDDGEHRLEIDCYDKRVIVLIGTPENGLVVTGEYGNHGSSCWLMGVSPVEEDVPVPWAVRAVMERNKHSMTIEIDAPKGVPIQELSKEDDDDD